MMMAEGSDDDEYDDDDGECDDARVSDGWMDTSPIQLTLYTYDMTVRCTY